MATALKKDEPVAVAPVVEAPAAPAAPVAPVANNVNRLPRRLLNGNFRAEAEGYLHTIWSADLQHPNEFTDVLAHDFWSIVAAQMKRGDIIYVRDVPHYTQLVQLYVIGTDRHGADVIELGRFKTTVGDKG